jgi:uncharacterized membrane protein YbhN (UPF0104 family)
VFYALLLVFIVVAFASIDWSALSGLRISWPELGLATLLSLGFRYLGVFIWLRLLRRLGARDLRGHYAELSYIYAKSWLGRYIPGTATWIVGKIYFAGRHGVARSKLAVSGLLEGALQIVATLVVGLILLRVYSRADAIGPALRWAMIATLVVSLVVLAPPLFNRLVGVAHRALRGAAPDGDLALDWRTMLEAAGLYILGALIAGTSYFLVALSVYPDLTLNDALYVIGAASVSSAISLLAVFAPGGLGVREVTLAVLLAPVLPPAVAVVLVVVLRVWSICVDLIFYATSWLSRSVAVRTRVAGEIS